MELEDKGALIRNTAEKLANVKSGRAEFPFIEDGRIAKGNLIGTAIKSDVDSEWSGFCRLLETMGSRIINGGEVEDCEMQALIERATQLGVRDPENHVRSVINAWSGK